MRMTERFSVMALVGMAVILGFGGQGTWPAISGRDGALASIAQRMGAVLSPAVAEAAAHGKAAKKATVSSLKGVATKTKTVATNTKKKGEKTEVAKASKHKPAQAAPVATSKHGKVKAAPVVVQRSKERPKATGRCEPQSLTYARQRSGIMRSRTGHENGPLTWFASERQLGKTSPAPSPGSVLILGSDKGHGMSTGHVAYVEKAYAQGPSRYKVIFSHTNYDRKCSMETNIEALYDSAAMTLDIHSGAWQPWGRGLRVAGFIQQE